MEHMVQATPSFGGGKFRRRLFRRSSTPYDRPPTSTRHPSWMSKLVMDPASKLFNFGARRFFAMVFPNKRLPPPSIPPPVEEQEIRNGLQETAIDVKINARVQEPVGDVCGTSTINNETSDLPELEELLKQKNFNRSEIDRLTKLLKSRAADLPVQDDRHGFRFNSSGQDSGRHQEFPTTLNINKSGSSGAHRAVLDPAVTTREQNMQQDLEDRIASPAELAKAYMSSRPTKVSPLTLGLRAQIAVEDSVPPSNSPYTLKSQLSSLPVKTSGYSGFCENGFTTPRSRGRSSIYNMARTPYSRFNPLTHQKVSGSKNYGDSRPLLLASRAPSVNGRQVASRPMALKRRNTVLDDEIGSIGPIRRIRQKHNLLSHGNPVTISEKGPGPDFTQSPNRYFMSNADTRRAISSSASYAHVPRESSEMAAKILEHLEKMTPKEKSLESKLAAAREGSTFKLTPHMLHGQALRSMEDLDASKLLQNSHKDQKTVDQPVSRLPDFHEFATQKQGPVQSVLPRDYLIRDRVVQGSDNSSLGYGATLHFSSQPLEKKHHFKMSAHENWIEMDDDCCNEDGPESLGKGLEEPMRDSKSALNEDKTLENSPFSLERTQATPVLSRTELEGSNVLAGENNTGFKFSSSFAPNTSSQKVLSQSTEVGDSHLLFSFDSATTRNNLTSVESKFQTSSSLKNIFSGSTNAVVEVTESDTNGIKDSVLDNTINGNLGKPPSLASNPMSTNNIVSVDSSSTNLPSNDGPISSSACFTFSSSIPASVNLANQSSTNSLSNMASSAGATTSTTALSESDFVPAKGPSSNLSDSVYDNGFSKKLFSAPSTTKSAEDTDVKRKKANGLGNFSNSSTISTFAGTSTGFSIFGLGTSASSSALNSQWPSSASGTSGGKESSLTGSGSSNGSLSTPVYFSSSSSSMGFALSGVAPLTASISFGSSVPATKSEGTTQISATASESEQVNSTNGAAPIFKFGGGASSEGNAFGSTDAASLATSQFSASFATPASSCTSLFSFNAASAPGIYSFNAGSSSSGTSVGNTTSGVFNLGAATSVSSSSANAMTSSNSTAPASFGFSASVPPSSADSSKLSSSGLNSSTFASSLQAPTSSPFTMPSSTGFSLGTSSSSTAPAIFGFSASVPPPSADSSKLSSSGLNSSTFASSLQALTSSPFTMPSSTGFSLGTSSPAFGNSNASMIFGSNNRVPSNPTFSFTQSAGTQSVFGNSASLFTTTPGNNDQMSAEDCMAEDPIHSSAPAAPGLSQSLVSPSPPGYIFGSTAPAPGAPFQFSQTQAGQQNPSQFQVSSSLEFNAGGGGFSLGSSDKSGRKFVKVNRNRNRKTR